ncbi:MAG TPA: hypothetical protein VFC69_01545 [Dysgonamonadaceae bacterium]|nr:hypothetical protein [Dysgonamonadaceae bacterium]
MKTYKLTPLDQLRIEEKQLREEIKISEQKMAFRLQYINDNWGSMLLKSTTSSIMNKVTDRAIGSSPVSSSSYLTRLPGGGWGNFFLSNYKTVGSVGWRLLKPLALTFLTRKATSMLFSRKKKR